jgi:hypothetical protein
MLFLYLHIYFHFRVSDDLEVYEIDQPSKDKFEEICDLRQPVILYLESQAIMNKVNLSALKSSYASFDLFLRVTSSPVKNDEELYTPLSLKDAINILEQDKLGRYISERNGDFLEETGLRKLFLAEDSFLRPALVTSCKYDIVTGSVNAFTPFRYELDYRHYIFLTEGAIKIKLAPPKSSRYMYKETDYENFEFRSPINPFYNNSLNHDKQQEQYLASFAKVQCLEIDVMPGQLVYIPAYWWYSVFIKSKATTYCTLKYRTLMNTLAISPQLCVHMLQAQNVQRKHVNVFAKSKKDGALSSASAVKEETDHKILTEQIIPPNSTLPVELQESLEHSVISTSEIAVTPPELS